MGNLQGEQARDPSDVEAKRERPPRFGKGPSTW
jgi:hypothetical protein